MPSYDFKHKETGEVTEHTMSFTALDAFKLSHPELEQVFLQMNVGDPVLLGVAKVPSDFTNHVLAPIERHYNNKKRRETRFGNSKQQV
jgi:hypothetical protein